VSINRLAPPDRRSYRVDFSLFRALAPAYQPQATLVETIDMLQQGLRAMRFQDQNFRDSSLVRLKVLADLTSRGLLSKTLEWTHRHDASAGAPNEYPRRLEAAPASL
jgi:hypothetical protein